MGAPQRLVIGLTGETGAVYGVRMLELLRPTLVETHAVVCDCVRRALPIEVGREAEEVLDLADRIYGEWNQAARISSGSFLTLGMVVAPCSQRSLGSIALGYANTLIHRAADVTMKEGRPLVLMIAADSLEDADPRHVRRLEQVPGVSLRASPTTDALPRVDALVREVLTGFGIEVDAGGRSTPELDGIVERSVPEIA
jgi:4-hydroxy-3-polyprenylbenzoate decarboxylase